MKSRPTIPVFAMIAITLLIAAALLGVYSVTLTGAALLYVPLYFLVAVNFPGYALMLLLTSALFPYSVSGAGMVNIALGDIDMLILGLALIFVPNFPGGQRVQFPSLLIAVFAYFGVCLFSNSFNGMDSYTIMCVVQMTLYMVLAIIIPPYARAIRAKWILYGVVVAGVFLASSTLITRSPYVLGIHKNALGAALNFCILVTAELFMSMPNRRKLLMACLTVCTAGLLFSVSRGAWLGTAVGLVVLLIYRGRIGLTLKLIAVLAPVITVTWILMPAQDKEYATDLSAEANSNKARFESIAYARANFERNPLFGVGVGLRKQYDATSVIMSTLAETGVVGLVAFLGIHAVFFFTTWRHRRKLAPGDAASSFLYIGPALITAAFIHGCVDHYWNRGLTLPWAAAGLALAAVQLAASPRSKTRRVFARPNQHRIPRGYTAGPSASY